MPLLPCKYMAMMHHWGIFSPGNPHTTMNLDCELAMSILLEDAIVGGRVLVVICVPACSKGRDYHLVNTCKQSNTPYSATLTYPLANPPIPIPYPYL